jgi:hypothetical protein
MRRLRRQLPALLFLLPAVLLAQRPLGDEILVNGPTRQAGEPRLATSSAGEFVITWVAEGEFGAELVYARRYGADGRPLTSQVLVTRDLGRAGKQAVAMLADGSFAVAFTDRGTGEESILKARWYSAAGALQGQTVVTRELVTWVEMSSREDGRLALAWASSAQSSPSSVRARVFGPDRAPLGPEIVVDPFGAEPAVALGPAGEVVVAWLHGTFPPPPGGPSDRPRVAVRRFNPDGTPAGRAVAVSPPYESGPLTIQVGKDDDGDFLVVWVGNFGAGEGTFLQRYTAGGAPLGRTVRLDLDARSLAVGSRGNFVLAWMEPAVAAGRAVSRILARRFAVDGLPLGPEIPVSSDAPAERFLGQVGITAGGGFVVTWSSDQREEFVGDVYVRRFRRK